MGANIGNVRRGRRLRAVVDAIVAALEIIEEVPPEDGEVLRDAAVGSRASWKVNDLPSFEELSYFAAIRRAMARTLGR
jgi:hypothetical protein